MSTYLELCQKMVRDLGLSNDISTVVSQTGMNRKIVDWVADADEVIQTLWEDWNFLWAQFSTTTISGVREYSKPADFGTWDLDSFYLDYISDDYQHLIPMDYIEWRRNYRQGTQSASKPTYFILTPENNIYLHEIPDDAYTLTADYWKAPTRLSANTDTSAIPTRFERIIIARAKIYYAEHEEFPAVLELASSEYKSLLDKLEAAELPGVHRARRKARNHDMDLTIRAL